MAGKVTYPEYLEGTRESTVVWGICRCGFSSGSAFVSFRRSYQTYWTPVSSSLRQGWISPPYKEVKPVVNMCVKAYNTACGTEDKESCFPFAHGKWNLTIQETGCTGETSMGLVRCSENFQSTFKEKIKIHGWERQHFTLTKYHTVGYTDKS